MTNIERARQFMPFAALRGFEEMIREQEREETPRRELSEDEALTLTKRIAQIKKGSVVRVTYYEANAYRTLEGMVSEIDLTLRFLRVVKKRIELDDISDLNVLQ